MKERHSPIELCRPYLELRTLPVKVLSASIRDRTARDLKDDQRGANEKSNRKKPMRGVNLGDLPTEAIAAMAARRAVTFARMPAASPLATGKSLAHREE